MTLAGRLMGIEGGPLDDNVAGTKIPVHAFQAVLAEFARGKLTGAQVQEIIAAVSGAPLAPGEATSAQAVMASITGSATAKLARVNEIDHVCLLAELGVPGYDTVAAVNAKLGIA